MRTPYSLCLVGFVGILAAFGCGPEPPSRGPTPQTPTTPAPSSQPSAAASGTAPSTAPTSPAARAKPVAATEMEADIKEIGLDPKALPPLNKLSPDQLRKVMKTFTKSLGVQCNGCHDTKDFRAPTPNKKIATHMWNDFTRALAMTDDKPLYCDSCHGGQKQFLDRKDLTALSDWMRVNYADKLKRVDKKDHGCETCHGDPIEPKIFANLWKSTSK